MFWRESIRSIRRRRSTRNMAIILAMEEAAMEAAAMEAAMRGVRSVDFILRTEVRTGIRSTEVTRGREVGVVEAPARLLIAIR